MTSRFFIFVSFMLASALAHGASVTQIKNGKVLLDMSGMDEAQSGDEYYALNADGKKRAVLKITQIKKGKAIAEILKGNPEVGHELQLKSSDASMSRDVRESDMSESERGSSSDKAYAKRLRKRFTGAAWGVMGEMVSMSMKADFTAGSGAFARSVTASMSGSSFGVLGFYDYPVVPRFQVRGLAGLENFNATGTIDNPDCDSGKSATCTFKVMYLSLYGAAKYNFNPEGNYRFWGTVGYGFLIAMSKDSNVIAPANISTNQALTFGVGMDIPMGKTSYIPLAFDYGMFPASDTVKATFYTLRAGYAWSL